MLICTIFSALVAPIVGLAGCATDAGSGPPLRAERPPNIVIFIADDLGEGDLGCYGHQVLRTPHIDRLAAEGLRFDAAFLTISSCSPSRASILTGRYPHSTRAEDLHDPLPADQKTIAHYLRAGAGYYTACVGKWHLGNEVRGQFDTILECQAAPTAANTVKLIRERPAGKPFFLWVASTDPHRPYQLNTIAKPHKPEDVVVPPYLPDHPHIRKELALYYDEIVRFDECVGTVRQALSDAGELDNTIIVVMSDNGMPFPRAKTTLYDSGLRTPLIVRWPGKLKPGTTEDRLVSLMDLGPTVLSLAGVKVPPHMQGQAFLGEQQKAPREYVFAHRDRMDEAYDMMRAVRDKRFKYIKNFFPGRPYAQHIAYAEEMPTLMEMRRLYKEHMNALSPDYGKALNPVQLLFFRPEKPPEELYDTESDPHEINNLAASPQHQATLKKMRTVLAQWQKDTKDLGLMPEDQLRERMRPGGVWAKVEKPAVSETVAGDSVKLKISSATEGASIAYTTEQGRNARWLLYTGDLTLKRGSAVRVKACRLGYLDSEEVLKQF